jgi:hypothetical protein
LQPCHHDSWTRDGRYLFLRISMTDVTRILNAIEQGDAKAAQDNCLRACFHRWEISDEQ